MKSNCRVDEHLYPASRVDAISPMPMMRGKSKRLKSMQPKPFENGVDNSSRFSIITYFRILFLYFLAVDILENSFQYRFFTI